MGVFATRSPARPNPIAMTASEVINIDFASGIIRVAFIDADEDTPVLDIKPYTPSFDRVEPRMAEKHGGIGQFRLGAGIQLLKYHYKL